MTRALDDANMERLPPRQQPGEPLLTNYIKIIKQINLVASCTHLLLTRYRNTQLDHSHALNDFCLLPQIKSNCLQWWFLIRCGFSRGSLKAVQIKLLPMAQAMAGLPLRTVPVDGELKYQALQSSMIHCISQGSWLLKDPMAHFWFSIAHDGE